MTQLVPRAPRREMEFPVDLHVGAAKSRHTAVSVNMSTSGMLIRSAPHAPCGTRVSLNFALFNGTGEVVRAEESEGGEVLLGVRFVSLERRPKRAEKSGSAAPSGRITFQQAMDRLLKCGVTVADLAYALGESTATVRRALRKPSDPGYRDPPDDWQPRLAEFAATRGETPASLTRELRGW